MFHFTKQLNTKINRKYIFITNNKYKSLIRQITQTNQSFKSLFTLQTKYFSNATNSTNNLKREKKCYAIIYSFIKDIHYKRIPFRDDHLKLIEKYEKSPGVKLIGGSFFPNDGGIIMLETDNDELPQQFVSQDPYYKNKLVTKYEIKELEMFQTKKFEDIAINYKYR